jgi:hypothetical protein
MKEFYAEECGQDYGVLCYQEQIRQSVTKELLEEILKLKIINFDIYFEEQIIEYTYNEDNINFTKEITINNFIKACNE